MLKVNRRKYVITLLALLIVLISVAVAFVFIRMTPKMTSSSNDVSTVPTPSEPSGESAPKPTEVFRGDVTQVANKFSIKVPNGWTASISENTSFLAVMFSRPNQLNTLVYNPDVPPTIDRSGIPAWSGLTEHFFVSAPIAGREFTASDHQEITSESFVFDDKTAGNKFFVLKHAAEAQKWGGLQKDTEWQGRTYIYEKNGTRVEAHLALYPSTNINLSFYESVVRSIQIL